MIFFSYVTILIVSLFFSFISPDLARSGNEDTKENGSTTTAEKDKKDETIQTLDSTPSTLQEKSSEYEIYPIVVPKVELPEDVHVVDSSLNLSRGEHAGFPKAPGINISIKKGQMKLSLNIDPTYSDLYFDINLKDLGVEDAKVPKEFKSEKDEPVSKEEREKTAQQERLLNKIDEMMKTLEKSKQAEKELKEREAEKEKNKEKEVLTKRQMENKILEHIDKAQRFYYKKKYGLALNAVQESLKVGESAMAYALEGTIYLALDDTTSATASWKKALELNPDMKEVRDILEFYQNEEE